MPKDVLYVFIHVTKTGGMTFKHWLERNFNKDQIHRFYELKHPFGGYYEYANREELICINGHFNHNFAETCGLFPGRIFHYFTLLREPIDRTLSFYYHQKSKRPELPHIPIWLENEQGISYFERINIMTKRLSSSENPTRKDLQKAKQVLKNINFGLTEQFEEAIKLFQKKYPEIFIRMDYKNQNANPGRISKKDEPSEIIELVREKNNLDVELYAFAKKLWKKKLKQ